MMRPEEHTVTHTINRYRSFRYELILEGVIAVSYTHLDVYKRQGEGDISIVKGM